MELLDRVALIDLFAIWRCAVFISAGVPLDIGGKDRVDEVCEVRFGEESFDERNWKGGFTFRFIPHADEGEVVRCCCVGEIVVKAWITI